MTSFLHELDLGDIIFSLAAVRAAGGGRYYLKPTKPRIYPLLKDLFNKQPYIESFEIHHGQNIAHDFSTFRDGGIPFGSTLGEVHARWIGVGVDFTEPWLTVTPSKQSSGKIVIARSSRYRNIYFPWKDLTQELAHKMLFVGLEEEWQELCYLSGKYIEYARTDNLLQVAELIAGAELFIGNQSSPYSLAEGLKKASVQETCWWVPDCIYPRDNAAYCVDGNLQFSFLGKDYQFDPVKHKVKLDRVNAPQGGWLLEYEGESYRSFSRDQIIQQLERNIGRKNVPKDIQDTIDDQTIEALGLEKIPRHVLDQMDAVKRLAGVLETPLVK